MNKTLSSNSFLIVFIGVNIFFVFLLIYKKTLYVNLSYEKQRLELKKESLEKELENSKQKFLLLKNPNKIQKYAASKLGMHKIKINQLKKLD